MNIEIISKAVKTLKDIGIICTNINVNMMFVDECVSYDNVFIITFYFSRERMEEVCKWSKIDIDKITGKAIMKMEDDGGFDYVRIVTTEVLPKKTGENKKYDNKKYNNVVKKIALDTKIDISMTLYEGE
jgi:hypothetical protein